MEIESKEAEKAPQAKPKGPSKKLLLVAVAATLVVVLLGIAFVTVFLLTHRSVPKVPKVIDHAEHSLMVPMREYVVNLLDYGGRRYLKVSLELEFEPEGGKLPKAKKGGHGGESTGPEIPEEIKKKETILRNYIINVLSSSSFNDIKTIEGKNLLQKAIILKCNMVLKSGKVLNVYFNDFIIQ